MKEVSGTTHHVGSLGEISPDDGGEQRGLEVLAITSYRRAQAQAVCRGNPR